MTERLTQEEFTHDYNFDCKCSQCNDITKYFHLKSKKEAQRLGYDCV